VGRNRAGLLAQGPGPAGQGGGQKGGLSLPPWPTRAKGQNLPVRRVLTQSSPPHFQPTCFSRELTSGLEFVCGKGGEWAFGGGRFPTRALSSFGKNWKNFPAMDKGQGPDILGRRCGMGGAGRPWTGRMHKASLSVGPPNPSATVRNEWSNPPSGDAGGGGGRPLIGAKNAPAIGGVGPAVLSSQNHSGTTSATNTLLRPGFSFFALAGVEI